MLMRKITLFAALGLAMALSSPAMALHAGESNRGGQNPMGNEKASARAHEVSRGLVNDPDLAAEDSGPGNDATVDNVTGDPGNSKDVNQGGDK